MSSTKKSLSTLAIIALVLAFFFPLGGFIVGIIAIFQLRKSTTESGMVLAIVATAVSSLYMLFVVGILAAIAIPNFIKFQCYSKQSEAKTALKSYLIAQETYYAENSTYADSLETLAHTLNSPSTHYRYELVSVEKNKFTLHALGQSKEMLGDLWSINEDVELKAENDVCRSTPKH